MVIDGLFRATESKRVFISIELRFALKIRVGEAEPMTGKSN
jgi:hypothetical protein